MEWLLNKMNKARSTHHIFKEMISPLITPSKPVDNLFLPHIRMIEKIPYSVVRLVEANGKSYTEVYKIKKQYRKAFVNIVNGYYSKSFNKDPKIIYKIYNKSSISTFILYPIFMQYQPFKDILDKNEIKGEIFRENEVYPITVHYVSLLLEHEEDVPYKEYLTKFNDVHQ